MNTTDPIYQAIANLKTALVNLTLRAIELDALPLSDRVKMTYTDAGQTYGWNEYRASIDQAISTKQDQIAKLTAMAWQGETIISVVR